MTNVLQDPLHEILERHLVRASTEDLNSEVVIQAVVDDYIKFLLTQGVHIPNKSKNILIEDLKEEVREMTVKRTQGAVNARTQTKSPATKIVRRIV